MRFVPVKTTEQQAALMLLGVRERLIRNRTQVVNAVRGYAAKFGITAPTGLPQFVRLLEDIQTDDRVPALARDLFIVQAVEFAQLQERIGKIDEKLRAWHQADERSRRLSRIPGVGPIGAVMLALKTPAPELFRSSRHFAAWLGLTPKDQSTGGKTRLGTITRAGDEALRSVLVAGATSVISHYRGKEGHGAIVSWINHLLKRKPPKLALWPLPTKSPESHGSS